MSGRHSVCSRDHVQSAATFGVVHKVPFLINSEGSKLCSHFVQKKITITLDLIPETFSCILILFWADIITAHSLFLEFAMRFKLTVFNLRFVDIEFVFDEKLFGFCTFYYSLPTK